MPNSRSIHLAGLASAAILLTSAAFHANAQQPAQQSPDAAKFSPITVAAKEFVRDGKPYEILSGELHYARIPREYWRDRLRKVRAMGLNTIQVYSFWNAHEPQPGVFDFSGNLDVAEFLKEAREENLNVLMRLGPYVCAEWDAGGFPAWLYKDNAIKVRTTDPQFLAAAGKYLDRIGAEISPYLASKGGPVIGLQIENEYGSYGPRAAHGMGADPAATRAAAHEYMEAIHQLFVHAGLGNEMFYTADGTDPEQIAMGELPGILAAANFGPGEAKSSIAKLKGVRPNQPIMVGEYWDGWFDSWGDAHQATDAAQQLGEIKWLLSNNYSFNVYMVHGGTTWGFMNGANFDDGPDGHYAPETTSYDYDAPIDEAGHPTQKYFDFRDAIKAHTGIEPPAVPQNLPIVEVKEFTLDENAPLAKNLPAPISVKSPEPMENFDQAYGYILYRTVYHAEDHSASRLKSPGDSGMDASNSNERGSASSRSNGANGADASAAAEASDIPSSASGDGVHIGADGALIPQKRGVFGRDSLAIKDLRDYAAIYINGRLMGTLDRRLKQDQLDLDLPEAGGTLDILVENTGRVNFGKHLPDGHAGITQAVLLNGVPLTNWKIYALPMTSPADFAGKPGTKAPGQNAPAIVAWSKHKPEGPSFYRGHFNMDSPADTFLDVSAIQKGFVWVNGHNAGRAWSVGPARTLYIPAPWLVKGQNEIIAFDIWPFYGADAAAGADMKNYPAKPKVLRGVTKPIYINKPAPDSTSCIWCEGGVTTQPAPQLVDNK